MDRRRREYEKRVNRVIDYINSNLDKNLSLNVLAQVALFSPFHFHRIFRVFVGEPLNDYIRRLRLEKGANMLIGNQSKAITDIALDCGFSSSATFARAFKGHFGISPSEWRTEKCNEFSKISKLDSRNGKVFPPHVRYNGITGRPPDNTFERGRKNINVEVKEMPAFRVAYVRHLSGYNEKIGEAWTKLFRWAGPRGLIGPDTKMIGIPHDNPDITPGDKCRYDACLTIPYDMPAADEIGIMTIPGGKHAVFHFEGLEQEIGQAYDNLYGIWLPQSGYQPEDRPCYEIYCGNPHEHPEKKFTYDICVPVKPL